VGSDGQAKLEKVPVCSTVCSASLAAEVKLASLAVDSSSQGDAVKALEDASGGSANIGDIRVPRGAVRSEGNDNAAVSLSITQVPLTDMLQGAFKNEQAVSPCLKVIPDSVVQIDPDLGICFDLAVGGSAVQSDAGKCQAMLARLTVLSSKDMTAAESDATEVHGGCRQGTAADCSCLFCTPHLTSFVVVDRDVEVAGEVTTHQLQAGVVSSLAPSLDLPNQGQTTPAPTPGVNSDENDGFLNDLPLVPLAAGCCATLVIALAVLSTIKRRRNRHALERHNSDVEAAISNPIALQDVYPHAHNPMAMGASKSIPQQTEETQVI
jgi:hypothetical protein